MTQKRTLHLLNGQSMYQQFKSKNFLEDELMIPFNEAMCYGDTCNDIFSPTFNEIRAKVHQVTAQQYSEITLQPLKPLLSRNFAHLSLWFDADMFCQINILTVLAWLDQSEYKEVIQLHIVGDKYELKDSYTLKADGYASIYEQVLIQKNTASCDVYPGTLKRGIELYLNYLNESSDLIQTIKKNEHVPTEKLVTKLILEFQYLGLGDTQYREIIKSFRN